MMFLIVNLVIVFILGFALAILCCMWKLKKVMNKNRELLKEIAPDGSDESLRKLQIISGRIDVVSELLK